MGLKVVHNVPRATIGLAVDWRFPPRAGKDLDAIDPKASSDIEAGNVLAPTNV